MICSYCNQPVLDAGRTVHAECEQEAAQIEGRGGCKGIMCPRCMPPGDPCCPYCNGTYVVQATEQGEQ